MITPTTAATSFRLGVTVSATRLIELIAQPLRADTGLPPLQAVTANQQTLLTDLTNDELEAVLSYEVPNSDPIWYNPVALDGLVFVIHPALQVPELSRAEIQAIFAGELTNWSQLGGPNLPILPVSREQGASTRQLLVERILMERRLTEGARIVSSDASVSHVVTEQPGAIGYTMLGMAQDLSTISVDGIRANPTTVAEQTYPLSVPLYFVSKQEPLGELRLFLAWLQSEQGQTELGETYGEIR